MIYRKRMLEFSDYVTILRRRKGVFLIPALLVLGICVAVALGIPAVYESRATILVEQQEVPADLVRSAVGSYAGERIQILSKRVMSSTNLRRIVERYGLYPAADGEPSMASRIERIRENTALELISADVVDPRSGRPSKATIAFQLGFAYPDPVVAQQVTAELVSLFLDENVRQRTRSATEASRFLAQEAEGLKEEVSRLERRLATFKERHIGSLPDMQQLNLQSIERVERDIEKTDAAMRSLQDRIAYLRSQMARMPSHLPGGMDLAGGASERLGVLEAEYTQLSARYSASHPDMVRLSRELAALRQEVGEGGDLGQLQRQVVETAAELARLEQRYSAEHPDVKKQRRALEAARQQLVQVQAPAWRSIPVVAGSDNPAHVQLQVQLQAAELDLRSRKQQRERLLEQFDEVERRLATAPQVEREYRELDRDYEQALEKYREVKAKQLEADLAASLEKQNKGERFSLLEPPLVPERSVRPNRLALLFLGVVLSLGAGLGSVAIAEGANHTVGSARELETLTGMPLLVVVPHIATAQELQRQMKLRRGLAILLLLFGVIAVVAFHRFVMPIDAFWYAVEHRLELGR